MPIGYTDESLFSRDSIIDNTPVRAYTVHLSDKQIDSLRSLRSRNFGGFVLPVPNEFRAIARMVEEVLEEDDETLDNYD